MLAKIIAGIVGGFVVAALAANVVNLVAGSAVAGYVLYPSWVLAIVLALKTPSGAKAWRYLLIAAGALSLTVPLALFWSTKQTTGTAVAGGLLAIGIVGAVFFLLGIAFLVIGFVVARDKRLSQVQEIDRGTPIPNPSLEAEAQKPARRSS